MHAYYVLLELVAPYQSGQWAFVFQAPTDEEAEHLVTDTVRKQLAGEDGPWNISKGDKVEVDTFVRLADDAPRKAALGVTEIEEVCRGGVELQWRGKEGPYQDDHVDGTYWWDPIGDKNRDEAPGTD